MLHRGASPRRKMPGKPRKGTHEHRLKTTRRAVAFAAIATSIPTAVTALPTRSPHPRRPPRRPPFRPGGADSGRAGAGCDASRRQSKTLAASGGSPATVSDGSPRRLLPPTRSQRFPDAAISGQWNPPSTWSACWTTARTTCSPPPTTRSPDRPGRTRGAPADPVKLTSVLYYHMALGLLGPDDIHGNLTTQRGQADHHRRQGSVT